MVKFIIIKKLENNLRMNIIFSLEVTVKLLFHFI